MSKTRILIFCIFSVAFFACQKKNNLQDDGKTYHIVSNVTVDSISKYQDAKIIDTVYAADPNGLEIKLKPDENSKTIGKYPNAERLEVIYSEGEWLGVLQELSYEYAQIGYKVTRTYYEQVYVKRGAVCKADQIKICNGDLYDLWFYDTINYDEVKKVKKYLKLELVSEKEYLEKSKSRVDFITYDTLTIKKKNGKIKLPFQSGIISMADKNFNEEDIELFNYVGQIRDLDKYIIRGSYIEWYSYILVDKKNGNQDTLYDFPFLSPDKKFLICVNFDYEGITTMVQFYTISGHQLKLLLETNFSKWIPIPVFDNNKMFWSSDGYFYVPVMHAEYVKYAYDEHFDKTQYLKIKPL